MIPMHAVVFYSSIIIWLPAILCCLFFIPCLDLGFLLYVFPNSSKLYVYTIISKWNIIYTCNPPPTPTSPVSCHAFLLPLSSQMCWHLISSFLLPILDMQHFAIKFYCICWIHLCNQVSITHSMLLTQHPPNSVVHIVFSFLVSCVETHFQHFLTSNKGVSIWFVNIVE